MWVIAKLVILLFVASINAQLPGETSKLAPLINDWLPGRATHYGPYPGFAGFSENGYQPNDIGVGCSNGEPGGDPRFNMIKEPGLIPNPLDPKTVWPIVPTVAVSEFSWGGSNKNKICFQKLNIRNANNHSQQLMAYVVDFCPTKGCHWPRSQRAFNVDLYGQRTFSRLGGGLMDGVIDVEIQWPSGITPNAAQAMKLPWMQLVLLASLGRLSLILFAL